LRVLLAVASEISHHRSLFFYASVALADRAGLGRT